MIDHEMRKAIFLLSREGMSIRQLSRSLDVSRKAIRKVIELGGEMPEGSRSDKIAIDDGLLRELYEKCGGYRQRMHEMLTDLGIRVGYSTLTERIRALGLDNDSGYCQQVEDRPGEEMQHDTSPYTLRIAGKAVKVVASLIYVRYSKMRYLKFYRHFDRFAMQCFLYEALMFFGHAAKNLIIDNTNLAVVCGSGHGAIFDVEMDRFIKRFGFDSFIAHEINHSDRKAGNERSFYTVVTNFFPGRTFSSMSDLNRQAREWATVIIANRPLTKKKIIPNLAFEKEKKYLRKIPPYLPPPYRQHHRQTDQYGYAAFCGNYYFVPGGSRAAVLVLEYGDKLKIFRGRKELAEYPLPDEEARGHKFKPSGSDEPEGYPRNQKQPSKADEGELRSIAVHVGAYLDFALRQKGVSHHLFIKKLVALYRKTTQSVFIKAIEHAHRYRVTQIETIERNILYFTGANLMGLALPDIDNDYLERASYKDGVHSDIPDLGKYDKFLDDKEDENGDETQ